MASLESSPMIGFTEVSRVEPRLHFMTKTKLNFSDLRRD